MVDPVGIAEIPTVDDDTIMLHTIRTDIFVADDRRAPPVGTRNTTTIHDNNDITIRSHRIRNDIDLGVWRAIFVVTCPQESECTP